MRIGLFGGAFDPPHVGHLMALQYAAAFSGLDEIWMVPDRDSSPWGKQMAPFPLRWEMTKALAFEVTRASSYLKRVGSSAYMADFVEHLRVTFPEHQFTLIMGSDEWDTRHKWQQWEKLEGMLEGVFVIPRDGTLTPSSSSTLIKHNLAKGLPVDTLIPRVVLGIIKREGLYGTPKEEN